MKKPVYLIPVFSAFLIAVTLNGCESAAQKESEYFDQNYKSWEKQEAGRQDSATVIFSGFAAEEWEIFKTESLERIRGNEVLITDLKMRIKKSGKKSDLLFEKWISIHEQQNKYLKQRIECYPQIQSDWAYFKHEINKDLDTLSKALNDLKANRSE